MNRQYDLRAVLIQIEERLSNEDRHRLHFLIGDLTPRAQRENVTCAGTLTLLESLFDRDIISQDYLDFLIRTFTELKCYDAVKRLKEFEIPNKSSSSSKQELLDDNIEMDKYRTISDNHLLSCKYLLFYFKKNQLIFIYLVDKIEQPLTTSNKQTNKILDNIDNSKIEARLLWLLHIIFVFLIVSMIVYIYFIIFNKSTKQTSNYTNIHGKQLTI